MKSLRGLAAIFVITLGLVSCSKKDTYQCDCTYFDGTNTVTDQHVIGEKSSQEDAEVDCDAHKKELEGSGATSVNCQTTSSLDS